MFLAAFLGACAPALSPPGEQRGPVLSFEPARPPDEVTPVVRLAVSAGTDPATLRLFRDELSEYHVGRIRAGELPNTLLEREVPTLAFAAVSRTSSVPLEVLSPGVYSLASGAHGLIGAFSVATAHAPPLLARMWPPRGAPGSVAVYCGEGTLAEAAEVVLEPGMVRAALTPGVSTDGPFADRCLRLEALEPLPSAVPALPPPLVGDVLLEPSPLFGAQELAAVEPACFADEVVLGLACATVFDDRLLLRANQPVLLVFREPSAALVSLETADASAVVQGLSPSSSVMVSGEAVDVAGRSRTFAVSITTAAAVPRVVINELLSNALGPEPAQEWVELVNGGSAAVDLAGYRLDDGGGSVTLPSAVLAPGAFLVLAGDGYVPDAAQDVVPSDPSAVLVLPALGKNGLSNSGELLRLFDAQGNPVSRFPALKASVAGVSLARRSPGSADDDSAAFAPHAPPGASPGGPNVLAE